MFTSSFKEKNFELPPFQIILGHVWQGSGSSENGSGSDSFGGAAFLMELEPF
jgi:hypothetical protein